MLLSTGERISCALCAMAINDLGHRAISLTGSQAGIVTDESHTKARILDVRADRIRAALGGGQHRARRRLPGRLEQRQRRHHARARRLGHDRGRGRRGAGRARCARSTPTSPASSPPTRGSSPTRASSTRCPSRRCSRWPPPAPACCSCARSSTRATTACASTAAPPSRTRPVPLCSQKEETMEQPLITAVTHSTAEARITLRRRARRAGRRGAHLRGARRGERQRRHDRPERARLRRGPAPRSPSRFRARTCAPRAPRSSRSQGDAFAELHAHEEMGKVSIVGAGMRSHPGVAAKVFGVLAARGRQHRDDLHLADQDLLRDRARPRRAGGAGAAQRLRALRRGHGRREEQPFQAGTS